MRLFRRSLIVPTLQALSHLPSKTKTIPMKLIKLTQGKHAKIDDEDYELISKWNWYASRARGGRFYAMRREYFDGGSRSIMMHAVLKGTPSGMETDHLNGDGLDNQKSNLAICTVSQNQLNRGKQKNNTSGFKGVSYRKGKLEKPWTARIVVNKKPIFLGCFSSPEDASVAYVNALNSARAARVPSTR